MKKLLIASTALVATTGIAAAEINLSGGARFGLQYDSTRDMSPAAGVQNWGIEKRFTVNITGSGETDGGMAFGGKVRIRSDEYGYAGTTVVTPGPDGLPGTADDGVATTRRHGALVSGASVWVGMGGVRVTAGNIDGAIAVMPGLWASSVGLTGLGWHGIVTNSAFLIPTGAGYWNWDTYSSTGNGAEGVQVDYSGGSFAAHLSHGTVTGNTAISGSYTFGDWTVALGAQQDSTTGASLGDMIVATIGGSFGDFGVNLNVARHSQGVGLGNSTKVALAGSYSMGDLSVNAFATTQNGTGWVAGSVTSYGVGAAYNLGGASLVGGIARVTGGVLPANRNQADFGIKVSF